MVATKSDSPAAVENVRLMLLLTRDENRFVEGLAASLSQPGLKCTRQDAIRNALAKLRASLEAELLAPMLPGVRTTPARKRAAKKR